MRSLNLSLSAFAVVILLVLESFDARADVELGVLSCRSVPDSRVNLLIRSTVDIKCDLKYITGEVERYKGETGIALGLDLSFRHDETFAFSVIATSSIKPGGHPVAGKYVGGTVSATAGMGVGAAALVGGSNDSFGLNPVALKTNRGAGIAGGIGFLNIEPDS